MPQLDGIRALAVSAVLLQHFLGGNIGGRFLPFGSYGVRVFFVLSGFLITGILLRERGVKTSFHPAGHFYARRFLRILPLYVMILAIASSINVENIRERLPWHAACLTNVLYALHGTFIGPEGAFWSLSVEEQFYFCWPWLMFFLPWEKLPYFIVAVILVGPIFRLGAILAGWNSVAVTTLTFACMDALGLGALLALVSDKRWLNPATREKLVHLSWCASCVLVPLVFIIHMTDRFASADDLLFGSAGALLGVWMVGRASIGFRGWFGRLLEHPVAIWIGVRSYGIYVIHGFMPNVAEWMLLRLQLRPGQLMFIVMARVLALALVFVLAAISWSLYERPINRLKKFFPYYERPVPNRDISAAQGAVSAG